MPVVYRRDNPQTDPREPEPQAGGGVEDTQALDPDLILPPEWTTRADRRTTVDKLSAGVRGLKHAVRGDSSFFVHAYRGVLLVVTAALIGVGPNGWCLLAICGALVIVAELAHSAVDTLARAVGDPEERALKAARDIAAAGVLVAVCTTAAVAGSVFVLRFLALLDG